MQELEKSLYHKECEPKIYATLTAIVSLIIEKPRLMLDAY